MRGTNSGERGLPIDYRSPSERQGRSAPAGRGAQSPGWMLGAVAAGLVFLAWRHFGPDFRRYLKLKSM